MAGFFSHQAMAQPADQYALGKNALRKMTGCYLVDYSYAETQSLKPGYERDGRIYDVNRDKTVKEWIYLEPAGDKRFWLQHVLFSTDKDNKLVPKSLIRHQSEDWVYNAPFLYNFVGPRTWEAQSLNGATGSWTRKVTNLDDGLRYQCAAKWQAGSGYPEWSCENYAPIPGRETRDMKRSDYNTLQRSTRLIVYGQSWLERQENVKTVHENDARTPLAKEEGKNWYVRLPDKDCAAAMEFAKQRQAFWRVLRKTWDKVLTGDGSFVERETAGNPPRFSRVFDLEADYLKRDLNKPEVKKQAEAAIEKVIEDYRVR
jgi:hypothetical protein